MGTELSDDDLRGIWNQSAGKWIAGTADLVPYFSLACRIAIAADRALNAAAEPVAWRVPLEGHTRSQFTNGKPSPETIKYWADQGIALEYAYAAPQPAQPLTDDQILQIASTIPRDDLIHDFARAIERAHGITGTKPSSVPTASPGPSREQRQHHSPAPHGHQRTAHRGVLRGPDRHDRRVD